MSLQCLERATQQTGSDLVGTICLRDSTPGASGHRSKADQRKIEKMTAGNYQDVELRHK
jgi:hypothetical protein